MERKRANVVMYQYGIDGLPQKIPIWELILHRFGFRTQCRSFVGGSPFPQNSRKNGEIFEAGERTAVTSSKAENEAINRRKAELPNGRRRVEELALRLEGELLRRKGSVPT